MKRVNGMVSDEAKNILVEWKTKRGFTTLDETLQDLLIEFKEMCIEDERDYQQEAIAQIEHENRDLED